MEKYDRCDQLSIDQLSILAEECETKSQPDEFNEFYEANLREPLEKLFRKLSRRWGVINTEDIDDLCQAGHLLVIAGLKAGLYSKAKGSFLTWAGTIFKHAAKRLLYKYNACAVTGHGIVKKTVSMSDLFRDDESGNSIMDTLVTPESLDPNRLLDLLWGYFSKKLRDEMSRYRDWYNNLYISGRKYYIPAYVWIILRIKISMLLYAVREGEMPPWNEVEKQVPWIKKGELQIDEPNWRYHSGWETIKRIWDEIMKYFVIFPSTAELDDLFFTLLDQNVDQKITEKRWKKQCCDDRRRMKLSIEEFVRTTVDEEELLLGKLILDIEKYHTWRRH